jgi:hypothetical protein
MTGDHHGRTAKRATLLVTATDEILGTHSAWLCQGAVVQMHVDPLDHSIAASSASASW